MQYLQPQAPRPGPVPATNLIQGFARQSSMGAAEITYPLVPTTSVRVDSRHISGARGQNVWPAARFGTNGLGSTVVAGVTSHNGR